MALVGFGTVGRSVARILSGDPSHLQLTHIVNRDVERKRVDWLPDHIRWTDNFEDALADSVDIVVELVGGLEPAGDWVRRALLAGKSVVTANKQLIAHHGAELLELARRQGCQLAFGASVAGGVPVVSGLQEGLAGDRLYKVCGILNGTCNYILSKIEEGGVGFAEALREAQKLGYAESDPTDDVEGFDARAKLAILARVGLNCEVWPGDIACRSIASLEAVDFLYARDLGCTIRQISSAELKDGRLVCLGATGAGAARVAAGASAGQPEPGDGDRRIRRRNGVLRLRRGRRSHGGGRGLRPDRHRRGPHERLAFRPGAESSGDLGVQRARITCALR